MRSSITSRWFFSDPGIALRVFLIFIKGDLLILLPLIVVLIGLTIWSVPFGLYMIGVYVSVRFGGEMVYWIHQQFGSRSYRPYDFGLRRLDNHAIYILYQLIALIGVLVGVALAYLSGSIR